MDRGFTVWPMGQEANWSQLIGRSDQRRRFEYDCVASLVGDIYATPREQLVGLLDHSKSLDGGTQQPLHTPHHGRQNATT